MVVRDQLSGSFFLLDVKYWKSEIEDLNLVFFPKIFLRTKHRIFRVNFYCVKILIWSAFWIAVENLEELLFRGLLSFPETLVYWVP